MIIQSRKLILTYFYQLMTFLFNKQISIWCLENIRLPHWNEINKVNEINNINHVPEVKQPEDTKMYLETLETKEHECESKKESQKLLSKDQEKLRNKIDTHEQLLAELKKREEARIEQEN